jgi:hypothetical protein
MSDRNQEFYIHMNNLVGKPPEKYDFGDLVVNGKIILQRILHRNMARRCELDSTG